MSEAAPQASAAEAGAFKPQRYGKYVLLDRLGRGGMAEVFRALATGPEQFQRLLVVKRILSHLTDNQTFIRMFVDEATICGRLLHPNIIQVHEFGIEAGQYFIAMEYVQGHTLSEILGKLGRQGERMPFSIAGEIVRQSCLGLAYAHARLGTDGKPLGIVHRDVNPTNLMVAYTGVLKILDFGIARVASELRLAENTDAGQVKGKSSYLAPEQLKGASADARIDIFAIGIVLHEMLTGRRLFRGGDPLQTMRLIQEMEIPPPSKSNPDVPAALDAIVMRALERDPARRFQNAGDFAEALEGFLVEQRYASQELPRFMRALFKDELPQEALPPREELESLIKSIAEASPSAMVPVVQVDDEPIVVADQDSDWYDELARRHQRHRRVVVWGTIVSIALAVELAAGVALLLRRPSREVRSAPALSQAAGSSPAAVASPGRAPSGAPAGAATAGTSAPRAPAAAAPAPPPAPPPELPKVVRLSITSEPTGAQVARAEDEKPLGTTPVVLTVPRGTASVDLRITKAGHVPGLIKIVPDADKPALITLAKVSEPPPPSSSSARPAVRPQRSRQDKVRNAVPIDPFAK